MMWLISSEIVLIGCLLGLLYPLRIGREITTHTHRIDTCIRYSCFFVYDHRNRKVTSTDSTAFYVLLLYGDSRAVLKYALFESFVRSRSTYYGNCTAKYISTKMSIENACRDPSCRDNTSTILCCTTPYQTSMKKMSLEV